MIQNNLEQFPIHARKEWYFYGINLKGMPHPVLQFK